MLRCPAGSPFLNWPTAYCLLLTEPCAHLADVFTSYNRFSPLTNHLSLLTSHFSLLTSHFSLLTSHFSLLTSHFSLLTSHFSLLTSHFSLLTSKLYRIVELAVVNGVPPDLIFGIDLRELPVPSDLLVNIFSLGLHPSLNDWVGANDRC